MVSRALYPAAAALVVALSFAASSPVGAQYCEGTVHGLSRHYDLDSGSGFLAVRARPNSSSRMIGQLFNGDHTEIFDPSRQLVPDRLQGPDRLGQRALAAQRLRLLRGL